MAPLNVFGHHWLIGDDDLIFIAPLSASVHVGWTLCETARTILVGANGLGIPLVLLQVDVLLCVCAVVMDILIVAAASGGEIAAAAPHRFCLTISIWIRLFLGLLLLLFGCAASAFLCWRLFEMALGWEHWLAPVTDVHGWGPEVTMLYIPQLLVFSIICLRGYYYVMAFLLCVYVAVPPGVRAKWSGKAVKAALRCIGASKGVSGSIVQILIDLAGPETLTYVLPSDIAYGIMLVQATQKQGLLASCKSERRSRTTNSDVEASLLEGQEDLSEATRYATILRNTACPPTPFNTTDDADCETLKDINHYAAFAAGIYGFTLTLFNDSVYPGTSSISPLRSLKALYRAMPCCQHVPAQASSTATCFGMCPPRGPTEGDWCWAGNEYALRRCLWADAQRTTKTAPELLWATWEVRGVLKAPPHAVLLDRERQELVIVVRGTLNLEDALADLEAHPVFFDPFDMAATKACSKDFNDETGLFAHDAMVACAKDLFEQLHKNPKVREMLPVSGLATAVTKRVVVCGHSLGAGVACLLAMLLRQDLGDSVHYIGFEPPGGLLSKQLAQETTRLGWISAVCANDWISRLSIKAMQRLRERVLDELGKCDRSKLQLSLLATAGLLKQTPVLNRICWPFAALLQHLGGGPLCDDTHLNKTKAYLKMARRVADFAELWPPGRIAYFRPVKEVPRSQQATAWMAEWARPEDLQEIIVSARSVELHFPNIILDAYDKAANDFNS